MNERIRLMAKANQTFTESRVTEPEVRKFMELIVKECIEQGDTLAKYYIDTHSEQEQVMLLASIADYSNEIKKHFGVE